MEWKAQNRRKRKRKARVSRKEAAAEIESDGRRKEIADEIMRSRLSAETLFDFIGKIITKKAMQKICIAFFIGFKSEQCFLIFGKKLVVYFKKSDIADDSVDYYGIAAVF